MSYRGLVTGMMTGGTVATGPARSTLASPIRRFMQSAPNGLVAIAAVRDLDGLPVVLTPGSVTWGA